MRSEDDNDEIESSDSLLREAARVDDASTESVPVHRAPGSRIGRFVLRGELGRGGMGVVYRAFDDTLNRSVALKVLPAIGGARADEAKARLLREARAAASLEHPHVVAIHEVGEDQGAPFIAMELVVGQTLRERMREPATVEEKIGWLSDVAEALAAAHDKGIVHRDIKPENVMIRRDGRVKVLDFGIARQAATPIDPSAPTATSDAELGTITEEGARVGTPRYMAPEQLKGDKLDGRCDQFAWGVLAYELFAGRPPWVASDAVSLIASILGSEPPALAETAADVPTPIAAVVERALSKAPGDRFASMGDVVEALKVREGTAPSPALRRGPQRRWPLVGLGATFIAGAVALLAAGRFGSADRAANATAEPTLSASLDPADARGIAITDLPLPRSDVPEALAAYKAGMQALRDGAVQASEVDFTKARKLDPSMGAAFLRAVEMPTGVSAAQRELVTQAVELRGGITEHDALLIDAVAPCWQARAGADKWCVGRVTDLTRRYPQDADFSFWRVVQLQQAGEWADARDEARRALRLDPRFARVSSWLGTAEWYLGDTESAMRDSCMDGIASTNCFITGSLVNQELGRAAEFEAAARGVLRLSPETYWAYSSLATALACEGRPTSEVSAALDRSAALAEEPDRARTRLWNTVTLAYAGGDFLAVAQTIEEIQRLLEDRHELGLHADAASFAVEVARETGGAERAGAIARSFLDKMGSLVSVPQADEIALNEAYYGPMLLALRRGGKLSKQAARAERDRWISAWEPRLGLGYRPYLWAAGYADSVDDEDDAREALEALPRFGGLPKKYDSAAGTSGEEISIGRVYLLAGQIDEAISWLERGVRVCAFGDHVVGHLWLGQALEQKGDKDKACEAYAFVLKRWGNAKPKSVTADEAKKRSKALGCPR